jgi:hypothetical protein
MSDLWPLNWLGKPRHLERDRGLHESFYGRGVYVHSWPRKATVTATKHPGSNTNDIVRGGENKQGGPNYSSLASVGIFNAIARAKPNTKQSTR